MTPGLRLKPADIVLTKVRGGGLVSQVILWATRAPGEAKTRVSHAALVEYPGASMEGTGIVESTWPRVQRNNLLPYVEGGIIVYRHRLLTARERQLIVETAATREGERYGLGKILWQAADALIAKAIGKIGIKYEPRIFRNLNLARPLVCSQLVAWAYERVFTDPQFAHLRNRGLSDPWQTYSPDDLDDELSVHPHFDLVYQTPDD